MSPQSTYSTAGSDVEAAKRRVHGRREPAILLPGSALLLLRVPTLRRERARPRPARAGPPRALELGESRLIARATPRTAASPRGGRRGARSGRAAPASGSRGGPRRSAARRYHGRRSAPTGAPGAGRRLRGSGGRPRGGRTTPGAGARLPRPGLAAFGLVPRRGGTMGGAPGASGRREPVADAASRAFGPDVNSNWTWVSRS